MAEGDEVQQGSALITLNLDSTNERRKSLWWRRAAKKSTIRLKKTLALVELAKQRSSQRLAEYQQKAHDAELEISLIQQQEMLQREQLQLAMSALQRQKQLHKKNAVSLAVVERQTEKTVSLRQSLANLQERVATKRAEIRAMEIRIQAEPLDRETKLAELRNTLSTLRSQQAELSGRESLVITAPVSGRVVCSPHSGWRNGAAASIADCHTTLG